MDITNFISRFVDLILNFFTFMFDTLNNITFYNISLLQYIISILVLGVIIEILFTLVTSSGISSSRSYAKNECLKASRRSERNKNNSNRKGG